MSLCGLTECLPGDLTGQKAAWLLWWLPIALIVAGSIWDQGRVWLWIPAFLIAGSGCVANAARCGRIHCYITGPLYLAAAVFVVLAAAGLVRLHPEWFLLSVLAASLLARFLEIPFGRYRQHG